MTTNVRDVRESRELNLASLVPPASLARYQEAAGELLPDARRKAGRRPGHDFSSVTWASAGNLTPDDAAAQPLTVLIAGRVHEAVTCRGCGELAPARFTWNGCHMMCVPDDGTQRAG